MGVKLSFSIIGIYDTTDMQLLGTKHHDIRIKQAVRDAIHKRLVQIAIEMNNKLK